MFRLPEDEIAKVKRQGGPDFEPMAGHLVGGHVVVSGDWRDKPPAALIKRALEHTLTRRRAAAAVVRMSNRLGARDRRSLSKVLGFTDYVKEPARAKGRACGRGAGCVDVLATNSSMPPSFV
ncbi:MAG TPA: hypothetical protein VIO37_10060 [Candidatus Dormibacteraeota bacterium]|jgi:hypothetical protein